MPWGPEKLPYQGETISCRICVCVIMFIFVVKSSVYVMLSLDVYIFIWRLSLHCCFAISWLAVMRKQFWSSSFCSTYMYFVVPRTRHTFARRSMDSNPGINFQITLEHNVFQYIEDTSESPLVSRGLQSYDSSMSSAPQRLWANLWCSCFINLTEWLNWALLDQQFLQLKNTKANLVYFIARLCLILVFIL